VKRIIYAGQTKAKKMEAKRHKKTEIIIKLSKSITGGKRKK